MCKLSRKNQGINWIKPVLFFSSQQILLKQGCLVINGRLSYYHVTQWILLVFCVCVCVCVFFFFEKLAGSPVLSCTAPSSRKLINRNRTYTIETRIWPAVQTDLKVLYGIDALQKLQYILKCIYDWGDFLQKSRL